jgi:hypothetical protein
MIDLESVGTGITGDGMCYPMLSKGGYDYANGTHISEDEYGEWRRNLSEHDREVVERIERGSQ